MKWVETDIRNKRLSIRTANFRQVNSPELPKNCKAMSTRDKISEFESPLGLPYNEFFSQQVVS